MKTLIATAILLFSAGTFANGYSVQNKSATITYDQRGHALVIGQSQRVTDPKGNTFNRGIGTYIPLGEQRRFHERKCPPRVYHHGKVVEGGC